MAQPVIPSEYTGFQIQEEYISRVPFRFFTETIEHFLCYRADIPFGLYFITLRPDTDTPFRLTVIAPDFYFYTVFDWEKYHKVISQLGMHQHNTYELIFVLEGELYQQIENERHKYIPGSCCLLNPNVRHMEDYSGNCSFVTLSLAADFLQSLFSKDQDFYFHAEYEQRNTNLTKFILQNTVPVDSPGKNYIDFIPRLGEEWVKNNIHRVFDLLTQQILNPEMGASLMARALIYKIFHFLDSEEYYHTQPVRLGNSTETAIFSAVTKCMEETHGRISRSELAETLNYSGSTISEIVRKFTGMSIFAYGTTFTMQEAERLLSTTTLTVSEIAARLSFSDRTHFYKLFRSAYGMTPKEYRKQLKK